MWTGGQWSYAGLSENVTCVLHTIYPREPAAVRAVCAIACAWLCLLAAQADSDGVLSMSLVLLCLLAVSCDVWLQNLFIYMIISRGLDLIVIKYSISRKEWSRTVSISWNNGFLMSRKIASRELRQINLQQMKILNTVIKPTNQHPYHFSEGRQVSRMSRHIVGRPSALNSGASGLPNQTFLPF